MKNNKRSSSSIISPAADVIGGNVDLLIEILLLLPAKSLIRFQVVSKHWRSLISAPSFSHLHTLRHCRRPKPQPSFLLQTNESQCFYCHPTVNRLIPFHFKFRYVKILQSCNGLLLLECRMNSPRGRIEYHICNPTTMWSRKLYLISGFSAPCLLFDPYKSPHYKVVSFKRVSRSLSTKFSVYNSETREWKKCGEFPLWPQVKLHNGIYLNGMVYFVRYNHSLVYLSLEGERFRTFSTKSPINQSKGAKKTYILESNGHMHHIELSLVRNKNRLYVFEMNDDCWFLKYRADFDPISASFAGNNGEAISLLGMIRGESEEDSVLLFHVPGKIMIYRFCRESFEVLVDFTSENYFYREGQLQFEFKDAHQFLESLVPV